MEAKEIDYDEIIMKLQNINAAFNRINFSLNCLELKLTEGANLNRSVASQFNKDN